MVGDNIRRMRESRGMLQADLAVKLNVAASTVSSWEVNRTEPKMGMIEMICVALNCQKSDIVGRDSQLTLTDHERRLVMAYRQNPTMQDAVDRLLGIEKRELSSDSKSA